MTYAKATVVPVGRTQEHIRQALTKHGATGFAFGEDLSRGLVQFDMAGRRIRFILPYPTRPSTNATKVSHKTHEQTLRSRWRAMLLAIKAKLECVEIGITTLEQEFMAHIVLPNGETVGDVMTPRIEQAYRSNKMPTLLLGNGD